MPSSEIRKRFLEFFAKRGHAVIPSASLVTSDEKGVTNPTLFNTAGMQPLIPYLLGKPYLVDGKEVKRLASAQKCLRTVDIDDVGDRTHNTFFEMLGNWSLGDYFKKEAISWSYEFLTNPVDAPDGNGGLGLDPRRLYITVFEGDANAPRDDEAANIWRGLFKEHAVAHSDGDTQNGEAGRIFYMPAAMNWWEAGDNGPCGPDTEMYYDIGNTFKGEGITKKQFISADARREIVEVWNDVFMQYEKKDGKIIGNLPKPSVDTGAGLERLAMTMQGVDNIYDTDLLKGVMEIIKNSSKNWELQSARIIADHLRAATFMIADGVIPSNTDRGYVLRKLIRRAIFKMKVLMLDSLVGIQIIDRYANQYNDIYHNLNKEVITKVFREEEEKFLKTLTDGMKEFEKIAQNQKDGGVISSTLASGLYLSHGFPIDLTVELAKGRNLKVDVEGANEEFKKHQSLSRSGASQKFKGGLADANDPMIVRYHTATHLLHQALHDVLGDSVMQKGSNITAERLRFDFAHGAKMTDEEKKRVEDIVNEKIVAKLPVNQVIMPRAEAEKTGARHFFGEKYGDEISIYFVGNDLSSAYSKEFCGGPHVKNTGELAGPEGKWRFKIQKEEAVAQGVRRIKAILG
jgi:alanyl-tRNA synthetase